LIDTNLAKLELDPTDTEAWTAIIVLLGKGCSEEQIGRLSGIVRHSDLSSLRWKAPDGAERLLWRGILAPLVWRHSEQLLDEVRNIARSCKEELGARIGESSPGEQAMAELLEIAALSSSSVSGQFDADIFCRIVRSVAEAWPEVVADIRRYICQILSNAPPDEYAALWKLRIDLLRFAQ
jgi:hypothetical protein